MYKNKGLLPLNIAFLWKDNNINTSSLLIAQLVERQFHALDVVGSNPTQKTFTNLLLAVNLYFKIVKLTIV